MTLPLAGTLIGQSNLILSYLIDTNNPQGTNNPPCGLLVSI